MGVSSGLALTPGPRWCLLARPNDVVEGLPATARIEDLGNGQVRFQLGDLEVTVHRHSQRARVSDKDLDTWLIEASTLEVSGRSVRVSHCTGAWLNMTKDKDEDLRQVMAEERSRGSRHPKKGLTLERQRKLKRMAEMLGDEACQKQDFLTVLRDDFGLKEGSPEFQRCVKLWDEYRGKS